VWTQPVAVTPTKAEKTGFNLLLANQLEFPAKGQPNWRESMAEFGAQTSNDNRYAIQIVQTERFDLSDMTVGVNGYYKLAKSTGIQLTAALSPDHRVMPEKRVQLQLSHTLSNGWGGIAGIGYTGYSESDVTSTDITIEKYIANYRLAYTLFRSDSNTVGAASSHRLQIGYYFPAASSLQLAYITGEEIEKLTDASTLLSSKVDTMAIWGELRLSPSVGLLYSAGKTWIKPFGLARTDREFIRIGLNYYF
jgi:YaiO family outer membrane protein